MPSKWQRLHLGGDRPPLLFSYTSTARSYELYLTDLTQLWSEHLNHKAILKRADETNTTIDPSEDPEQLRVLLQKVEDALRGKQGSAVSLNQGYGNDSLELIIFTELPAPLKPLKWALYLAKEPLSSSTSHLLLPLLQAEARFESRQRALLDHIRQKDWVLGKLFDKIETMGIDLSTVFPGASGLRGGRQGTTLSQAARYIKGVAPFDATSWAKEASESSPEMGLGVNLLSEITGSEKAGNVKDLIPATDKWWNELPEQGTGPATPAGEKPREESPPKPAENAELDTDAGKEAEDDEFERQETPPRFKQKDTSQFPEKTKQSQKPPSKSPSPPPEKLSAKQSKGLGKIGGKKQTKKASPPPQPSASRPTSRDTKRRSRTRTPEPEPEPEQEPQHPKPSSREASHPEDGDEATASDSEPTPKPPPAPPSEPTEAPKPKPKKAGGLGVIGGKKKEKPPPPKSPSPPDTGAPPPSQTPKRNKLGVISGKDSKRKDRAPSPAPAEQVEDEESKRQRTKSRSRSPVAEPKREQAPPKPKPEPEPAPEPEKEATEQERADRKREELKRQLDAKSKAPVKKKRKF